MLKDITVGMLYSMSPPLHPAAHHSAVIGDDPVGEKRLLGPLHLDDEVPASVGHTVDVEHDPLLRFRISEQFGGFVCDADDILHDIRKERPEEGNQPFRSSL